MIEFVSAATAQLLIFARFHAKDGRQDAVATTIKEVLSPTRQEPGASPSTPLALPPIHDCSTSTPIGKVKPHSTTMRNCHTRFDLWNRCRL
jgi:hypothetical protein